MQVCTPHVTAWLVVRAWLLGVGAGAGLGLGLLPPPSGDGGGGGMLLLPLGAGGGLLSELRGVTDPASYTTPDSVSPPGTLAQPLDFCKIRISSSCRAPECKRFAGSSSLGASPGQQQPN